MGLTNDDKKKFKSDRVSDFMKWQAPRKAKTKQISRATRIRQPFLTSVDTLCGHPLSFTTFFQFFTTRPSKCPKIKGVYKEKELMSPRATAGPKMKAMRHHEIPMVHRTACCRANQETLFSHTPQIVALQVAPT
mmetsp:Transcript_32644/g.47636  ORF Transcript_32644/g.47636 Transcript_32644/m.47636 type:complete len:134 (+) Transcript_32644:1852-2253(+)